MVGACLFVSLYIFLRIILYNERPELRNGQKKQLAERSNRQKGGETTGQKKTYQKGCLFATEAEEWDPEIYGYLEEKMECIPQKSPAAEVVAVFKQPQNGI